MFKVSALILQTKSCSFAEVFSSSQEIFLVTLFAQTHDFLHLVQTSRFGMKDSSLLYVRKIIQWIQVCALATCEVRKISDGWRLHDSGTYPGDTPNNHEQCDRTSAVLHKLQPYPILRTSKRSPNLRHQYFQILIPSN